MIQVMVYQVLYLAQDQLANQVALEIRTGSIYVNDGKRDIDAPFEWLQTVWNWPRRWRIWAERNF